MKYHAGDVVRFKNNAGDIGLYEVAGYYHGVIHVTDDECISEFVADEDDLLLVCRVGDREDLTHDVIMNEQKLKPYTSKE